MAAFYPNLDVIHRASLKLHRSLWARADRSDDERRAVRSIRAAGRAQPVRCTAWDVVARIGDSADLAESILTVLNESKFIAAIFESIKKSYDPDSIAQEYEKLFAKLMEKS
jgi:hypothetical protein